MTQKKQKPVEVYICPQCQSTDVGYTFELKNLFGIIPRMKCKKCGYSSTIFPQWVIDKKKLEKQNKKAVKKTKKKVKKR